MGMSEFETTSDPTLLAGWGDSRIRKEMTDLRTISKCLRELYSR